MFESRGIAMKWKPGDHHVDLSCRLLDKSSLYPIKQHDYGVTRELSSSISFCLCIPVRFLWWYCSKMSVVLANWSKLKTSNCHMPVNQKKEKKEEDLKWGVIYSRKTVHFTDGRETDRPSPLPLIVPWSIFWATGAESRQRRQEKCGEKCPH